MPNKALKPSIKPQLKLVTEVTPEMLLAQAALPAAEPFAANATQGLSFDDMFALALRAERRIGERLEAAWQAGVDTNGTAAERLRLSALALITHDDPYADLYDAKPWALRFSKAEVDCSDEEKMQEPLAFWIDAGHLAAAQTSGRASLEVFEACIERVRKGAAPDANAWLYLAILCVGEANSRQQPATACALIEMVTADYLFASIAVVPSARWHYISGYGHFLAQNCEAAVAAWMRSSSLINKLRNSSLTSNNAAISSIDALDSLSVELHVAHSRLNMENNDLVSAQNELNKISANIANCIPFTRISYHHIVSRLALRSNRFLEAQHHLDIAREVLRLQYRDPGYSPVVLTEYLQVLFALNRWDAAVRTADEFKPHFERHGLHYGEFLRQAALTRMWAEAQGPDCETPFLSSLRAAMDLAVKHDFRAMLRSVPTFASWLCAQALEQGIHTQFAREVVTARKLPTPPRAPRQWPWAVWLDVIGPFTITLEGQRLALTGKVAQKPLELIKLLACTKRYTLSLESAAMQLWPETEELSAARKNLEVTIARARKLIGDAAIKVGEGRVQLDAELVGCDMQYILDTCAEAESLAQRNGSLSQLGRAVEQLIKLDKGELLQADEETLWLSSARQYLRSAFVRATLSVASVLQGHNYQSDEVTRLLENAISREPLAEQLYAKLMQHYAEQGRNAEALHTYRRCKQNLSVIAGLAPSRAIEMLKEKWVNL